MTFYPDLAVTVTSNSKDVRVKSVQITAADALTLVEKLALPKDSTLIGVQVIVPVGTATATVSVGLKGGSATAFVNAASAATAGQFWPVLAGAGNLAADSVLTTQVGTAALTSPVFVNVYYTT